MLFLINAAGVPSVASIVSVTNNVCSASLTLGSTTTSQTDCSRITHFTVSNPTNALTDYHWIVNGTYVPSQDGATYLDWTTNTNAPTVQVEVNASRNCAGGVVSAYTGFTSYFPNCISQCSTCYPRPATVTPPTTQH